MYIREGVTISIVARVFCRLATELHTEFLVTLDSAWGKVPGPVAESVRLLQSPLGPYLRLVAVRPSGLSSEVGQAIVSAQ